MMDKGRVLLKIDDEPVYYAIDVSRVVGYNAATLDAIDFTEGEPFLWTLDGELLTFTITEILVYFKDSEWFTRLQILVSPLRGTLTVDLSRLDVEPSGRAWVDRLRG